LWNERRCRTTTAIECPRRTIRSKNVNKRRTIFLMPKQVSADNPWVVESVERNACSIIHAIREYISIWLISSSVNLLQSTHCTQFHVSFVEYWKVVRLVRVIPDGWWNRLATWLICSQANYQLKV
jgi:hypothetical protein